MNERSRQQFLICVCSWPGVARFFSARSLGPAILIGIVSGCAELPAPAVKEFHDAEADYRAQRYAPAVSRLDKILSDYPDHKGCEEAYYLRALCRVGQSDKAGALADALACIKYSKQPLLTAKAHVTAGAVLFETGKFSEALPHLAAALRDLPERPPADLVRYQYGLCLQREGRWREAKTEFGAVLQKYPQSSVAEYARRYRDWPHEFFSIQCGAFRDQASAAKLQDTLRKSGLPARVESRPLGGETQYVVYVGQYASYEQARGAVAGVQRKASGAVVVP